MAYIINIDISPMRDKYQKIVLKFSTFFGENSYDNNYLTKYKIDNEEDFDTVVSNALDKFTWVLFTYFTTYHTDYITFATKDKKNFDLYLTLLGDIPAKNINIYPHLDTTAKKLKYLTFNDDCQEGEYVLELSKNMENKKPYLICCIEENQNYYRYDTQEAEFEDFIWYEEYTALLKEVKRFSKQYKSWTIDDNNQMIDTLEKEEYIIYEITDEYAYLALWEMASTDYSIAQYTISANTNLEEVEKVILKYGYESFDFMALNPAIPWTYSQVYGGGSDEHHAIFYAQDAKYTDNLSHTLKNKFWSRY